MPKKGNPGCCGCQACTKIQRTVQGCNGLALSGAAWEIKLGGTTVASGTTDATGYFEYQPTTAGSYTVNVTRSRFNSYTATVSVTCPGTPDILAINMAVDTTTYVCRSGCAVPYKKVLQGTTGGGIAYTLTSISGSAWSGTVTVPFNPWNCGGSSNQSVTVILEAPPATVAAGNWRWSWAKQTGTCPGGGVTWNSTGLSSTGDAVTTLYGCPFPLSLSFTGAASFTVGGSSLSNPFAGTNTITE